MVHWNVDKKTVVLVGKMGNIFSKEGKIEKQLRCKDCKMCVRDKWQSPNGNMIIEFVSEYICVSPQEPGHSINPGQFACNRFVYKDK